MPDIFGFLRRVLCGGVEIGEDIATDGADLPLQVGRSAQRTVTNESEHLAVREARRGSGAATHADMFSRRASIAETPRKVPSGTPVEFRTTSMARSANDLKHQFEWKSSTGNIEDLEGILIREHVSWEDPADELKKMIAEDGYKRAGRHTGLGSNPGTSGAGTDNHSLIGMFSNEIFGYRGPSQTFSMVQRYEYSSDGKEWTAIADSEFKIERSITPLDGNHVRMAIRKTSLNRRDDPVEFFIDL